MRYEIVDAELQALDADERYVSKRHAHPIARAFRKVMGLIRAADDERDLRAFKSLRLEKLAGDRAGQHSLRLNRQSRLIVVFQNDAQGRFVVVIEIVDYH